MKKKIFITLGVIGIIVLIITGLIFFGKQAQKEFPKNNTIYVTFDNFEFLNEYIVAEGEYNDKHIKEYGIGEQMNVTIKYEGIQAYLVAYIFENDKDCRNYASDVSGNDYDYTTKNKHIYNTSAFWYSHKTKLWFKIKNSGQYLVYYGDKLYYVKSSTSSKNFSKLIKFINSNLPQLVEWKQVEENV